MSYFFSWGLRGGGGGGGGGLLVVPYVMYVSCIMHIFSLNDQNNQNMTLGNFSSDGIILSYSLSGTHPKDHLHRSY